MGSINDQFGKVKHNVQGDEQFKQEEGEEKKCAFFIHEGGGYGCKIEGVMGLKRVAKGFL